MGEEGVLAEGQPGTGFRSPKRRRETPLGGAGGCGQQKPEMLQRSPSKGRRMSLQEELLAGGLSKSGVGLGGCHTGTGAAGGAEAREVDGCIVREGGSDRSCLWKGLIK